MLVSVIILVFNGEKYIKQALETVYSQSYKNFEVVCVNDGSTDNTEAIVKNFDKKINLKQQY
ncbi:MAG: glycosyltransferase family A protein [Thermodesulfobacteriota bacterium]|jgi:glycosyltransferase involved in cell wall biosynthesis